MNKKDHRIILASRSPARRLLMKTVAEELGISFECHTSDYQEDMDAFKTPGPLCKFLALQKAKFIADQYPHSIIIGADTIGTIGNRKYGKPATLKEARATIRTMSNNKMKVHTGLAVIKTGESGKILKKLTEHVVTTLTFDHISSHGIEEILKKDRVLETAGALTIEGESGKYAKHIDGDFHNIMGLPTMHLKTLLKTLMK